MENDTIKVLHLDDAKGWRGGQQQAWYLVSALVESGYTTRLVCQPNSTLADRCLQGSVPFSPVRMHNELDFIAGWRVARICRKQGFTLLHAHSAHALAIAIWARMFNASLKVVAARRVDFSVRKSPISVWKYKNGFVDKIVCISEAVKKVLLKDGIPVEKLTTINDGIDLYKFKHVRVNPEFRERMGIPADHFIVGTVAALVGHKDYPNLLRAAKRVIERHDQVTFLAVGNGKDEMKLKELAADLALGERFIFAGYRNDVGPFLRAFDLFVAASKKEGLGTSVLDALAAGLPVVGTRAGGIPESVQDGLNGLLVPVQNPEALAGAILDLINQPQLRQKMSRLAPESVAPFSIENIVRQTITLYREICAEHT